MANSLEAALDELYGSDPSEFVAVRTRVAKALADDGDKAAAKEVRGARRPSTSAWALNQLARTEPQLVCDLLERGAELVSAQTRSTSATPDALRDAIRSHRDALTAATDAAVGILGARANEGFRSEIASTLRAASTDEDVGAQLRAGRLVREISASGFPEVTGLTLVPSVRSPKRERPPKHDRPAVATPQTKRTARGAGAAAAASAAAAAEERERAAKRRADRAARDAALRRASAADRDAQRARTKVERFERELEDARAELTAAEDRGAAARREADDHQ